MSRPLRGHPPSKKKSTTELPAALRSELGLGDGDDVVNSGNARSRRAEMFRSLDKGKGRRTQMTRKDQRKAKRQGLKEARANHTREHRDKRLDAQPNSYASGSAGKTEQKGLSRPASAPLLEQKLAKSKTGSSNLSAGDTIARKRQAKHVSEAARTPLQVLMDRSEASDALSSSRQTKRRRADDGPIPPLAADIEDDRIQLLEKLLGHKRKTDTGFDGLLGDFDELFPDADEENSGAENESLPSDDEDGADSSSDESEMSFLTSDSAESSSSASRSNAYDSDSDFENSEGDGEDENAQLTSNKKNETAQQQTQREIPALNGGADALASPSADGSDILPMADARDPAQKAQMTTENAPGRYIPPAMRAKQGKGDDAAQQDEEEIKLRRHAKGQLNRLGENNLEGILGELEKLYGQHPRGKTTNAITSLIIDTITANNEITDTLIVLYAALAACLHRIIGDEFAAHFVESLTNDFTKALTIARQEPLATEGNVHRDCRSLAALISAAYSVDIIACPLVYDVIKTVLRSDGSSAAEDQHTMTEADIDVLLRIVKLCGPKLRKDDALSLKSIVQLAQSRLGSSPSSRARFMIDSLQGLSSSRSKTTAPSVAQEQITKMCNFISGLGRRRTFRTRQALRVTLKDLQTVKERGRWWVVGAGWAGYDFDKSEQDADVQTLQTRRERQADESHSDSDALSALAKEHGLNTPLQQQIFVILLSSQDYLDAVQRLLALTHRRNDQRKHIVPVLLSCLRGEPAFNPYYVVVGTRLSREDTPGTNLTMRNCLKDLLRSLADNKDGKRSFLRRAKVEAGQEQSHSTSDRDDDRRHLDSTARAFGWWIAQRALDLEPLKLADFVSPKKNERKFLQLMLAYVLLGVQASSPAHMLALPPIRGQRGAFPASARSAEEETDLPVLPQSITSDIESLFVQGTRSNKSIAQGLVVLFESHLRARDCHSLARKTLGLDTNTTKRLIAARNVALETVRVGTQLAARDDVDAAFDD